MASDTLMPFLSQVSDKTPFIADLKPSGKYVMEDLHKVRKHSATTGAYGNEFPEVMVLQLLITFLCSFVVAGWRDPGCAQVPPREGHD